MKAVRRRAGRSGSDGDDGEGGGDRGDLSRPRCSALRLAAAAVWRLGALCLAFMLPATTAVVIVLLKVVFPTVRDAVLERALYRIPKPP